MEPEYNDQEILERIAEVEAEERPFQYEVAGVEWDDIEEFFEYDDFGTRPVFMIPNRMNELKKNGYLKQVYPSGSSANASYRLTRHGWNAVDTSEPD